MLQRLLRPIIFGQIFTTLGYALGVMQVVLGHWVTVVVAGREGPGLALGLLLAALLTLANGLLVPILRRAARSRGAARWVARAYMAVGVATLLVGVAILGSWIGLYPLAQLLTVAGVSSELAFEVFRIASATVVASLGFMIAWGFTVGKSRVERTHVRVEVEGLHDGGRGLRIVQISDLHIGNRLQGEALGRLVDDVNAHAPDLIVLTGDIFDNDPSFVPDGMSRLGRLRARYGTYAVLGNHDTYTGTETVAAAFGEWAPNLRLLRKDVVRVPVDFPLYLAGVDDPGVDWAARGLELDALNDVAASCPDDGPTVLLVHRPEAFHQASKLGFQLVLSGHTHGGQLALPIPGGNFNLARLVTPFHRGLYRVNGSTLYVNRGFGFAGPAIRFNCSREIATIELVPAGSPTASPPPEA
ncbi:MAG: metallophosphoesterase [Deltaproteobacteria bacterium]|nr:MAG: metallophosphoesterase [Deltaproteobacteria bacterium]